ncbi:transposase [Actinoplanes sp. ATCC 53533]|uniref:transposase n=1 Tax=Actinoplanes sp. ATCC 53533 TaxID=1288362 RepID=UPI001F2C1108|nr:transposase [Actinoplanes sp. ATCC 53533]
MLAQVQIAAKSNEIPAFTPLLRLVKALLGSLEGVLVVADALHAQVGHAELLAADGGHLMVTVKANQRKPHDQFKGLPWSKVPIGAQTRETDHGRKGDPHGRGAHRRDPGWAGIPPRATGRPDHPHPHDQGQDQPRDGVPDDLAARRPGPARPGPARRSGHVGAFWNGISRTVCITYETSRYVKRRIKPDPATAPPCSPSSVTTRSGTTASTAPPTSPKPPERPATTPRPHHRRDHRKTDRDQDQPDYAIAPAG